MTKLSKLEFFNGIMLWGNDQSGLSFENKRVSTRTDPENMEAFFYAFHERKDFLQHIAEEFYKVGIKSNIIPLSKYTKNKDGYVLETQRHPDFTKEFERWYKDEGGLN
jgi:hypothetical protein